jgi:hypothetical protein
VSQHADIVIRRQRAFTSRAGKAETFEVITAAPPRYWALLWPRAEDVSSLFRMVMRPVRVVPVALLWATSKPVRLVVALVVAVAVMAVVVH